MSLTRIRPMHVWALLIVLPGIFVFTGSLPFDLSTRRTVFGLVSSGIVLIAAGATLLVRQRAILGPLLGVCAAALTVLLMSTRIFTGPSQLPVSMVIAVVLAVMLTALGLGDTEQDRRKPMLLFAAVLIVLTPVWGLYSLPVAYAHRIELWPGAILLLAGLWGIPLTVAAVISQMKKIDTRQLLLNVMTGAISTLLTLGLIEAGVRIIGLDKVSHRSYGDSITVTQRYPGTPENPGDYVPNQVGEDTILNYDFWGHPIEKMVTYTINAQGFRDVVDYTTAKPPNTYRIAFLGDSFAFGLGAQQDKIVAHLLGPMLSQSTGCNVQVYNFGESGFSSINEAAQYKKTVLAYNPDMTIVWYFLNDPNLKGTTTFLGSFDTSDFFPIARKYSALARVIATEMGVVPTTREMIGVYHDGYALYDDRWLAVVDSLQSISDLARQHNSTPVLFVHPVLFELDDNYPFADIHAQVMQTANAAGYHAFDLFPAFKGQQSEPLWVSPGNQHPNEEGHAIAAAYAAAKIKDLIPSCKK